MIRLAATACDAALVSWGLLMLVLCSDGFGTIAVAAYAVVYGAMHGWLIFRGARHAVAAGRAQWLRLGVAVLSVSLPLVFLGLALADGGAPLEWAGAALMVLPAFLNWRAIRAIAGGRP
ncbi:MAG: hypothetical protein ACREUW_13950 [Burkholderiales bacterium]